MNISCLISDSSEAIRLLTLDVYKMIVYSDFALINNHRIEISSSKRSLTVKLDVMQICSSLLTRIEFSHGSFSSMYRTNKGLLYTVENFVTVKYYILKII